MKEDYDEKLAELNKTRAAEIEMKNKLEEHQKVLSDYQKRSRHWQEELSKLSLHRIKYVNPWNIFCRISLKELGT